MSKSLARLFCLLVICLACPFWTLAQPGGEPIDEVYINSGDPNFPFPQFLPYVKGVNLGTENAPGLTHADMEKSIREAYEIMMNRTFKASTTYTDVNGTAIQYLGFNNNDLEGSDEKFVSEGDGYAMLAAAYMADKVTFDGLWMWIHDNRLNNVVRYQDCDTLRPNYPKGGGLPGWKNDEDTQDNDGSNDSAADGDWDIGLALVMAYRQWGDESGIIDACGNEISYREAALDFMLAMTDTVQAFTANGIPTGFTSGIIGFDGYPKDGNPFGEATTWALPFHDTECQGDGGTLYPCPNNPYFDYMASGYYTAYAAFLEEQQLSNEYDWNISQFQRARASSTFLMQKLHDAGHVPYAGGVSVNNDGTSVSFPGPKIGNGAGENFRLPWRTISDYMWHGDPTFNWNPVDHTIEAGTNATMLLNAQRVSSLIKQPSDFGNPCQQMGNDPYQLVMDGPMNMMLLHDLDGTGTGGSQTVGMNWHHGSSMAAAVVNEDTDLLAQMYQQCEIEWDTKYLLTGDVGAAQTDERYIESIPVYFHGWFRLLGMLTATGNLHSATNMVAAANMKVYLDNDKTFGFPDDEVTYKIDYRNYGKLDAEGVQIRFQIPSEFEFLSAEDGGVLSGNEVVWNIGTVQGFTTGNLDATRDSLKVTFRIVGESGAHVCPTAQVSGSNFSTEFSNEFPNNATSTMERNCYDIVDRALLITKSADKEVVNPGDQINYTVEFENSSDAGWLNGGRPGVRFMYSHGYQGSPSAITKMDLYTRIIHGAKEPYINYKNYRFSFFVNETSYETVAESNDGSGWYFFVQPFEGAGSEDNVDFSVQKIPFGSDAQGSWNQRLIVRFADQLAAPSHHLWQQYNNAHRIHKGTIEPFEAVIQIQTSGTALDYSDDWSFTTDNNASNQNDVPNSAIVNPDWTDPLGSTTLDKIHPYSCDLHSKSTSTILVEEFDGYGWRRVFGNGPLPGREAANVVVVDTLPDELIWGGFVDNEALGENATYDLGCHCISWSKDALLVGEKGSLEYFAFAKTESEFGQSCPIETVAINKAVIYATSESPQVVRDTVRITCDDLPDPPPPATSMYKTTDKAIYTPGETIEYQVAFTQTEGAISIPDLNSSDGWTVENGSPFFGGGEVGWSSSKEFILNDYTHGTNGDLDFEVDVNTGFNNFAIILRYQSGDPGSGSFDGLALQVHPGPWGIDQGATLAILDNGVSVQEKSSFSPYSSSSSSGTLPIHIQLAEDVMRVWVAADYTVDAPTLSASGLSIQPGYVGFFNGKIVNSVGTHSGGEGPGNNLTAWDGRFDSGFEIELWDVMPAEVTFVPGSINVLYDEGGTYNISPNFDGVSEEVRWSLVSGNSPMLYGDSVAFEFSALVDECGPGFITNTAYADVYGFAAQSIGDQVVNTCQSEITCGVPQNITLTPDPIGAIVCTPNAVTLTAAATGGTFEYEFYDANGVVQAASNNTSFEALASGAYYVVVTDPTDPATCIDQSLEVTVTINAVPTANILTSGLNLEYCGTTGVTLVAEDAGSGAAYAWSGPVTGDAISLTGATQGTYTVEVSKDGCTALSTEVTVVELPGPLANITNIEADLAYCAGGEGLTLNAEILGGSETYAWAGPVTGTNTSLSNATEGEYILTVDDGVCSSTDTVQVMTKPLPSASIISSEVVYCASGDGLTLEALDMGADSYTWMLDGANEGTDRVLLNAEAGEYDLIVTKDGCSDTTTTIIFAELVPDVAFAGDDITICEEQVNLAGNDPAVGTGVWEIVGSSTAVIDDDNAATSLVTNLSVDGEYEFRWTVSGTVCPPTSDVVKVTKSNVATVAVGIEGNLPEICEGETIEFTAIPQVGGNRTYEWLVNDAPQGVDDTEFSYAPNAGDLIQVILYTDLSCAEDPKLDTSEAWLFTVDAPPSAAVIDQGATLETCLEIQELNALNITVGEGNWSLTGDGSLSSSTGNTVTVEGLPAPGQVTVTLSVENGVCTPDVTSITIDRLGELTTPSAGEDDTICVNSTEHILTGSDPGGDDARWYQEDGTPLNAGTTTTLSSFVVGAFKYVYEVSNGSCEATDTVTLVVEALPSAASFVGDDSVATCATAYFLTGETPAVGNVQWSIASGPGVLADPLSPSTEISGLGDDETTVLELTPQNGTCLGAPVTFKIHKSGEITTPIAALVDEVTDLCIGETYELNGNPAASGETAYWYLASGTSVSIDNENERNSDLSATSAGAAELWWVIDNDLCDSAVSKLTVNVTGQPAAASPITGVPTDDLCEGETITLSTLEITDAQSYVWTYPPDATVTERDNALDISFETGGEVTVAGFNQCGLGTEAEATITVILATDPLVTLLAPGFVNGDVVCTGESIEFTAIPSNEGLSPSYQWFDGSDEITGAMTPTYSLEVEEGTHDISVRVTASDEMCNTVDFDLSEAFGVVVETFDVTSEAPTLVCQEADTCVQLFVNGGGGFPIITWEVNDVASLETGQELCLTDISEDQTINYSVQTRNKCTDGTLSGTVTIQVSGGVNAEITLPTSDTLFCAGDEVTLEALDQGSLANYAWFADFEESGEFVPTGGTDLLENNQGKSGRFYVLVSDGNGCDDLSDTLSVDKIEFSIDPESTIYVKEGDDATLDAVLEDVTELGAFSFTWTEVVSGGIVGLDEIVTVTPVESTTYQVVAANATCADTALVTVVIQQEINPPSAFTPNGDGMNEAWNIPELGAFPDAIVRVFNRWGNLMYEQKGSYEPWDGTFEGKPCAIGTYYFIIDPQDNDLASFEGSVTIVR